MAKIFLTTLDATTSPGPFNIYYNTTSSDSLIAASPSSADKASLLLGVYVTVSDDVKSIFLENIAIGCGNIVEVNVLPPTPTPTSTPTPTPTPTSTPIPPTATPTPTPTATPTATPTPTPTATPVPPTATPTPTPTATPTVTATPTPTPTSTPTPEQNCSYYDLVISQTDIDNSNSNVIYINYYNCADPTVLTTTNFIAGTFPDALCACDLAIASPFLYYYDQSEPPNITVAMNSSATQSGNCGVCGTGGS